MRVCIDRSALGTPSSLVIGDDGTFEWTDSAQCDVCLFDRERCDAPFEDVARLAGISLDRLSVSTPEQVRAFAALGIAAPSVPWFLALGREQFREQITKVSQTIQDVLRDHQLEQYVKTYGKCRKFLRGLSRPLIDLDILRRHVSECDSGLSVIKSIKSFTPETDGSAPQISYDQTRSSTGRLIVDRGPSILTLPKVCKDMIRSRTGGIFEVDFVSLEPRFVLHVMGRPAPKDIYEDIRSTVFGGELTRKIVKTATISALYGSSSQLMADLTGAAHSARAVTRKVKEYFGADELGHRLATETLSGSLHNYYGRPLIDMKKGEKEPMLISHYVQSSCVDTAILGFSSLCERIKSLGARPTYVIHDAVLIDVPTQSIDRFMEICAEGIDLEVGHFALGVNRIS